MKNQPLVSIIIATYNRSDRIKRAVESVLNQTYQSFEIVIIDDSPNNETEEVIDALYNEKIKYTRNKVKTNLPAARNQGVRETNPDSEYVAFLDDDDEWLPQFLEKTIGELEKKKDIVGVIPYFEERSFKGERINIAPQVKESWNTLIGNGSVLRKDLFVKENIWFDERLLKWEDIDFGLRVLKNHKMESINEILQIHYHPVFSNEKSSLSATPTPSEFVEYLYRKHLAYCSGLGRKPLSFFYFTIGKIYCRGGEVKKGRPFFVKAFLTYPHFHYLIFYFFWFFPRFAQGFHLLDFLPKLRKIFHV